MFVVDTNVLVSAADQSVPEHARCRALIEQCRRRHSAWFLTWEIGLRVPAGGDPPAGLAATVDHGSGHRFHRGTARVARAGVPDTDRHAHVLAEVVAEVRGLSGNIVHDTQTAVLMREHGSRRIGTRDTDFHRFPFLEPVDPLSSPPL